MKASLRPIVELEVRRRLAREELKARVKADALALKVAELKALKAAPKAGKAKVVKANAKPVKPVKPKAAPVKVTVATVGATAKVTAKVTANVNSNAAAQTLQAASEGLSNYMGYEFFDNE